MTQEDKKMLVGELARKACVSVRTLQYYDKQGLLSPSARSEGGRRLYDSRDLVRLHQIISLKFLGFSLEEIRQKLLPIDSPEEVAGQLERQEQVLRQRIDTLTQALRAVQALHGEVLRSHQVDFDQYATIVSLCRMQNENYWVVGAFDNTLISHIRDKYGEKQEEGEQFFAGYQRMVERALVLIERGVQPGSEEGQTLAADWWEMVMEFTGGDLSLLPNLMTFNEQKDRWDPAVAQKQAQVDLLLNPALEQYLIQRGILSPQQEDADGNDH